MTWQSLHMGAYDATLRELQRSRSLSQVTFLQFSSSRKLLLLLRALLVLFFLFLLPFVFAPSKCFFIFSFCFIVVFLIFIPSCSSSSCFLEVSFVHVSPFISFSIWALTFSCNFLTYYALSYPNLSLN